MPPIVDDNHRGTTINIALWIVVVSTALATALKVFIKAHATKELGGDDAVAIVAFLIVIGQTVTIGQGVNNGLGTRNSMFSSGEVEVFYKTQYALELLYAFGVVLIKLTPFFFFPVIAPTPIYKKFIRGGTIFLSIWAPVCVFVTAFQCRLPDPWRKDKNQCIPMSPFWLVFLIVDVASQIIISALPILMLRKIQMTQRWQKIFAMLCFSPNILTIPIAIARYIFFQQLQHSDDYQWDAYAYTLVTGLQTPIALFIVCLSFAKPFVDSIVVIPQVIGDTALGRSTQLSVYPRSNFTSTIVSQSARSKRASIQSKMAPKIFRWSATSQLQNGARIDKIDEDVQDLPERPYTHLEDVEAPAAPGTETAEPHLAARNRDDSHSSRTPLVIMKTTTATVSSEPR